MDGTRELGEHIISLAAHINAATRVLLTMIADFDQEQGWKAEGRTNCADWLSCNTKMSMSAAYEHVRVAKALRKLPAIDDAFGQGRVSYTQVRAMTRTADEENEETVLAAAEHMSGEEVERLCRGMRARDTAHGVLPPERYLREKTMGDGTVSFHLRVTADEAEIIRKAMREMMMDDSSAEESEPEQQDALLPLDEGEQRDAKRADAVVQLARLALWGDAGGAGARGATGAERNMLLVHLRVKDSGAHEPPVCSASLHESGHWLSRETFERLSCDCSSVVARTDEHGNVLDIGRRSRSISTAIWRALLIRDETCTWPGCCHQAFTEAHHIQHWGRGHNGETKMENLIRTCSSHHVLLHEGGFVVELTEDGPRFYTPKGEQVLATRPPPEPIDDPVRMLHGLNMDTGLRC